VDYQSRSGLCPQKKARDRLIRLAASHPEWALGFEDETWWSRVARPARHAWTPTPQPLRLVEQPVPPTDPDPKALACYGLLLQERTPQEVRREHVWLRFVADRPVSWGDGRLLDLGLYQVGYLGQDRFVVGGG
jgi:hypothetical protein